MSGAEDLWAAVAAAGTEPAALAACVAHAEDAAGRAHLRRAVQVAEDGDLLHASAAVAEVLVDTTVVPAPTAAQRRRAAEHAERWRDLGVRVALRGDAGWPARLARAGAPPLLLAWRGAALEPTRPSVALVGARRATGYGRGVAAWLAEAAADAGVVVVSGGALGIDAAAHDAALHGPTVVVLGCGHGVAYPRPHARPGGLFDRVLEAGGTLVSELLPATEPRPGHVRARNRIVAALSDAVVVVEGGATSGALVTAGAAADAGVEVLAVPGDVRAPGSAAPHRLLTEGAAPCTSPQDLLAAVRVGLSTQRHDVAPARSAAPSVLPDPVLVVLEQAWPRPVRAAHLAERAGLSIGAVLAALTRARVAGEVVESHDGVRLARGPGS